MEKNIGGGALGLLNKLAGAMKKNKKLEYAVYIAIAALGVTVYALTSSGGGEGRSEAVSAAGAAYAGDELALRVAETEERLEAVLSSIRGAGRVEVMITYDTGGRIVPAMSTRVQTDTDASLSDASETTRERSDRTEDPATVSRGGSDETVVLTEIQPVVRGVIVVAEGAADISVRLDLAKAVGTVLGVESGAIEVFEMSINRGEE